jgi:GTPase SAR1 family protein
MGECQSSYTKENENMRIIKFILLGPSESGKTVFFETVTGDTKSSCYQETIGIDDKTIITEVNEKKIKLTFWDTAGNPSYKSNETNYYKKLDVFIIIYRAKDDKTLDDDSKQVIDATLEDVKKCRSSSSLVLIIGNYYNKYTNNLNKAKVFKHIHKSSPMHYSSEIPQFLMDVNSKEHVNNLMSYILTEKGVLADQDKYIDVDTMKSRENAKTYFICREVVCLL